MYVKVLKSIVSSFSEFGSIPKPIRFCVALFSGVFGFCLIFVYARLDLYRNYSPGRGHCAYVAGYWRLLPLERPRQTSPACERRVGANQPGVGAKSGVRRGSGSHTPCGEENFWEAPPRSVPRAPERQGQPLPPAGQSRREAVTLLDLTEPLFQYVCRLNRIGRRRAAGNTGETTMFTAGSSAAAPTGPGMALDEVAVRSEIKALLEEFLAKASADFRLGQQARKVELPLIFFIDSVLSESALPFAAQWNQNRLAYERQELAGDEKFFDLLDETMKESGEDAAERLAIFYTCIGLGFTGIYFKQPEFLRKTMLGLTPASGTWLRMIPPPGFARRLTRGWTGATWSSRRAAGWCSWAWSSPFSLWRS